MTASFAVLLATCAVGISSWSLFRVTRMLRTLRRDIAEIIPIDGDPK